jgi:uncharacterized protein with NRDE domain
MCTVLLRFQPGSSLPLVVGAVRDEFVQRAWDPPARHWSGARAGLIGGRDHTAGGTWLAVDPVGPCVAALLNAGRRDPLPDGQPRPTRGDLALRLLSEGTVPEGEELDPYDRFHLLRADGTGAELWSWDGESMAHVDLNPGDHLIVNAGLDTDDDPLVPHFRPLLAATADDLADWELLLQGDDLQGDDDRALVVRKTIEGHDYGTTSATLVAFTADGTVTYRFNADPLDIASWSAISV